MQNIALRGHQLMVSALSWGICQKISSKALNWGECVKTDICGYSQIHK